MDVQVGDTLTMKKPHPCGCREWRVLRVGMDLKVECLGCGRQVMAPRRKIEHGIQSIRRGENKG